MEFNLTILTAGINEWESVSSEQQESSTIDNLQKKITSCSFISSQAHVIHFPPPPLVLFAHSAHSHRHLQAVKYSEKHRPLAMTHTNRKAHSTALRDQRGASIRIE